jgi:hypothetical protein
VANGIINPQRPFISDADLLNIFTDIINPHQSEKSPTEAAAATAKSKSPLKPSISAPIDLHLKSLATKIGIIPDTNSTITAEERAMLATLDNLTMLDSTLKQVAAVEAEEVEAESWNVAALNQLVELSQKVGGMPFPPASDLFNLAPSGAKSSPHDGQLGAEVRPSGFQPEFANATYAGPLATDKGKGKEKAHENHVDCQPGKRTIFNLHPRDAERTWWSPSRQESGKCRLHKAILFY